MPGRQSERFLTTVLFTDIVGSTELAAELGDRGWRDLVQEHHRLIRAALRRHGGREVDTAGDGFFVIFDAPAAAAQCAIDAVESVQSLGIHIRAGIHVGEVEQIGAKVGGIAVPTAARIMAAAGGSEILASGTVRDLAAGSRLLFEDRGERELKGVPGTWRLFAVNRAVSEPAAQAGAADGRGAADQAATRRAAAVRRSQTRPFWQRHPRATGALAFGLALVVAGAGAFAWSPWRPRALAGVPENSLGVIDPGRNEIVAQTNVEDQPAGIGVGDGAVWVTNGGSNTVSRVDPSTRATVDSIDVGLGPAGVAIGGGSIWVANSGARSVTRINAASAKVVDTIAVGNGPTGIAFASGAVWVTNAGDGTLTRIDATTGEAAPPISIGSSPDAIAADDAGLWVASQDGATVSHLDPTSGALLAAPIPVGSRPAAIVIAAGSVWVANAGDGSLSRIDPALDRVIGVINVGGAPNALAVDGTTLWVADGTGAVLRVDTGTASVTPTRIATGSAPQAIALVNGEIWFASRASAASHRGGILTIVGLDPVPLDPISFGAPQVLSLIGDTLVGYRRIGGISGSQLVPHLATSIPKPTDGGLTYAFHLRAGIRYSDGTPVLASDFTFAMQRIFQVGEPDIPSFGALLFSGLAGADACQPAPVAHCDLASAVEADDAAGTVTFHLVEPDPDFLFKLALEFGHPLRPGSVPKDGLASRPYPTTGPYQVDSITAETVRLVRNPHFQAWDPQVRPAGFVDEIIWSWGVDPDTQVKMVESGAADYMADQIPADAFAELETRFTPQLHLALQSTTFLFFNTRLPPFDQVAVRQAVSMAIDRTAVGELRGGAGVTRVTCQILPPNFPGYEPYCPYSQNPAPGGRGPWTAPDLAAARTLVAESGAADTRVVVGPFVPRLTPVAGYVVGLLRAIGFTDVTEEDATEGSDVFKAIFKDQRIQMGAFEFIPDFPSPGDMFAGFTCAEADGLTNYCGTALDDLVKQARDLQTTDPPAAAKKWAEVDRAGTDLALWAPLLNEGSDLVSARLGNYQYNASYGILLDQAWVK
ncbi:MAG: ABC transporter substrate-binding protein [Chloroflexota bacterium]